jgi:hypothetical protein
MYQLTGYADSDNIVIDSVNNIAYYHYAGTSYRDKLKNGLRLEQLYEQEEDYFEDKHNPVVKTIQPPTKQKYSKNYIYYDDNSIIIFNKRNKKVTNKKVTNKDKRKNKKNLVRQNGYDDKLFNREQNLSDLYVEEKHADLYTSDNVMNDFNRLIPLFDIPDNVLKKYYLLFYKMMSQLELDELCVGFVQILVPFSVYSGGTYPECDYDPECRYFID